MCGDENSIVISRELHAANLEERALSPDVCPTVNCGAFPPGSSGSGDMLVTGQISFSPLIAFRWRVPRL